VRVRNLPRFLETLENEKLMGAKRPSEFKEGRRGSLL